MDYSEFMYDEFVDDQSVHKDASILGIKDGYLDRYFYKRSHKNLKKILM